MAERYPNRSFPAGSGYDRDAGSRDTESDPLAELARLIGQTDPFGTKPMSRANLQVQPQVRPADPPPAQDSYRETYRDGYQDDYYDDSEPAEQPPPAPPSWMQRAARHEAPPPPPHQEDYPSTVHPLHRYAAEQPPAEPDYHSDELYADTGHEPDPSRYDDALYGAFDSGAQQAQHDQAYGDDYAYDEDERFDAQPEPKRRGGMITVAAVLALAVFGVGGALAYRSYTGGARGGDPPIIRADAGPTKIIPAPADASAKVPDRMAVGDGSEKIVSREETPIDPSTRPAGPRVVFPPLTPSAVVPGAAPTSSAGTGTFANNDPRQVRTFSVRGDQSTAGAPPAVTPPQAAPAAQAPAAAAPPPAKPSRAAAARAPATNPNAANANGPLSLAPQPDIPAAPEPVRVAATNPVAPAAPASSGGGGGYLVQVSSQLSEADAQASFRSLQSKYPSVLGSQSVIVKRVDLGEKGVHFRAFAGPFTSSEQATQVCSSLKAAGGPQCLIQRN